MGMIGSLLGGLMQGSADPQTGVYKPSPLDVGLNMLFGSKGLSETAQGLRDNYYQNTVMRPMQMRIMRDFMNGVEGPQGQGGQGGGVAGGPGGGGITPGLAMLGTMVGYNMDAPVKATEAWMPHMTLGPDNIYRNEKDASYGGQPLVKVPEGAIAVPGANGGPEGVTTAPGAISTAVRAELAKGLGSGLASAATNMETPVVDGVPTPMSRLSAIQQSGGTGLGSDIDSLLGGSPLVPQAGGPAGAPQGAPGTTPAATPPAAAPGRPVRPVQRGQRAAGGNGLRGTSPDTQAYRTAIAQASADRFKNMQDAGAQAPGAISRLKLLDSLLGNYEGGVLGPAGYEIASGLNSVGIKGIDPHLANKDAAQMLQRTMAAEAMKNPDTGANMFPRVTNFEYENALKQVPGMLQTAAGRHLIVQMKTLEQQRIIDTASKARAWQQRFGRVDAPDSAGKTFQDRLDDWATKHPLYSPLYERGLLKRPGGH